MTGDRIETPESAKPGLRRAVYGGSFDPPHVGHVLAVSYVLSVGWVDRVTVVPVYSHAFAKDSTSFKARLSLARLAFEHDGRVEVSDLEASLPTPSFTLKTLEELARRHPGDELRLLIGADVLADASGWHRWDEVVRLAPPLVLGRAGVSSEDAPPAVLPQVSSTDARDWFASDTAEAAAKVDSYVPASVVREVRRRGLYRSKGSASKGSASKGSASKGSASKGSA